MTVLKPRTWAAIAALVMVHGPVMLAVNLGNASLHKQVRHDKYIERLKHDATNDKVDAIVRITGDPQAIFQTLRKHGIKVRRSAMLDGSFAIEVSRDDLEWLDSLDGVEAVSTDAPVATTPLAPEALLTDLAGSLIQKNELRALLGLTSADPTGNGIGVAVIDSGIAPVAELAGKITGFYDFTDGQPGVAKSPTDGYGHGTHVAGLIAGSGINSLNQYAGVAPNARLIGLRVLKNDGQGQTSDVIAALQFAVANRAALGIDIINMSLGHPSFESAKTDPLVRAVEAASRAGIIVVVSAGNVGVNPDTNRIGYGGILVPGNAPSAFTVASAKTQGTVNPNDDLIANYSSRGPTWIDGYGKPDFAAPGQNLVAPAAPGSYLATQYPSLLVKDIWGKKSYIALSGTSMAAGVESGLVAVVLEANRKASTSRLTGNAIKAFMEYSAFTMRDATGAVYDRLTQGAGRVNGQGVLNLTRSVDPSVKRGLPWIIAPVLPSSLYAGVSLPWGQNIVWGENLVWGENIIRANNIVWGENIIWGENIVWGENLVWGENVVWGENLVWGENILWGEKSPANDPKKGGSK